MQFIRDFTARLGSFWHRVANNRNDGEVHAQFKDTGAPDTGPSDSDLEALGYIKAYYGTPRNPGGVLPQGEIVTALAGADNEVCPGLEITKRGRFSIFVLDIVPSSNGPRSILTDGFNIYRSPLSMDDMEDKLDALARGRYESTMIEAKPMSREEIESSLLDRGRVEKILGDFDDLQANRNPRSEQIRMFDIDARAADYRAHAR